ncbi:MAG: TIM barrel protein [Candidatus Nanoarchaeia archaeon]|nr:TIM barrel protein [Candidatus Nanoarchaeia archaeon]
MTDEEAPKKYMLGMAHPLGEPAVSTLNRAINWGAPQFELGAADITRTGIQAVKELSRINKMELTYHVPSYQGELEFMIPDNSRQQMRAHSKEDTKRYMDTQIQYIKEIDVKNVMMHPTTMMPAEEPDTIIAYDQSSDQLIVQKLPEDEIKKAEYITKTQKKDWRDAYENVKKDYIKELNNEFQRKIGAQIGQLLHQSEMYSEPQYGGSILKANNYFESNNTKNEELYTNLIRSHGKGELMLNESEKKVLEKIERDCITQEGFSARINAEKAEKVLKENSEVFNSIKNKVKDRAEQWDYVIETQKKQYNDTVVKYAEFIPKKFIENITIHDEKGKKLSLKDMRPDLAENENKIWNSDGAPKQQIVLHRTNYEVNGEKKDPFAKKFADEFAPFAEKAIKEGITIGLEVMDRRYYCSTPEFMNQMMDSLKENLKQKGISEEKIEKHIGLGFDYGHANTMVEYEVDGKKYGLKGITSPEKFAEKLKHDIVHVHYSENWGDTDAHLPVGRTTKEGEAPDKKFKEFTNYLRSKGYEGPIISEGFLAGGKIAPISYREAATAAMPGFYSAYGTPTGTLAAMGPSYQIALDPLHPDKNREGYFFGRWAGDFF